MRNQTRSKNFTSSKFLGKRRKFFLNKRISKPGFNFIKSNQGTVTRSTMPSGAVRLIFKSDYTGRTALAYGQDFFKAYFNLISNFNLKYAKSNN